MVSQRLKQVFRAECQGYEMMHVVYKEALDMIFLKLSRIASGQAGYRDHWDDIAGYAKLASKQIDASWSEGASVPPSR